MSEAFELIMPDVSRVAEFPSSGAAVHGLLAMFRLGEPDFPGAWTYEGQNRTMCGLLGRSRESFGLTDRGMAVTCVNCKRVARAWLADHDRITFPWDWRCRPPHGEKFASVAAMRLHDVSLESFHDDDAGDADGPGWWARFDGERAVLMTNSQGFVTAARFETDAELSAEWVAVERLVEKWENGNGEEDAA